MLELTCGVLIAISVYLILAEHILNKVLGIVVLTTAINLILLLCGRLQHNAPAFIGTGPTSDFSNPLPQALILTAIVIGFGLLAILCTLVKVIKK